MQPENKPPKVYFKEGLAIDYKWFDQQKIKPRFEFGFGLSYSKFELSDLRVEFEHRPVRDTVQPTKEKHKGSYDLYDTVVVARVTVQNVGKHYAAEAPQLVSTAGQFAGVSDRGNALSTSSPSPAPTSVDLRCDCGSTS